MSELTAGYPDPIHGHIILPIWLVKIINEKPVRRMQFIRQLGLKAYIDFPGAIHTRFSHALGCMSLAGKVVDLLVQKETESKNPEIAATLAHNKDNLMAAGFFHDIGHGPFSHAIDFVMKKLAGKTHEEISAEVLDTPAVSRIEKYGPTLSAIKQIITEQHTFPFVGGIVSGPLDVDKLDYLLRDSYHVGLRYSFDSDHFVDTYKVLGEDTKQEECELGLEYSLEARTTAEIFMVIWAGMYELIYNREKSRIAEKMLEKAVLLSVASNSGVKACFTETQRYAELYDEILLEKLKEVNDEAHEIVNMFLSGETYPTLFVEELTQDKFNLRDQFLGELSKDEAELADKLSESLCKTLGCGKYGIICDIIKSKVPKPVHLDKLGTDNEPLELKEYSPVVNAIEGKNTIKIYVKPPVKFDEEHVRKALMNTVEKWS